MIAAPINGHARPISIPSSKVDLKKPVKTTLAIKDAICLLIFTAVDWWKQNYGICARSTVQEIKRLFCSVAKPGA